LLIGSHCAFLGLKLAYTRAAIFGADSWLEGAIRCAWIHAAGDWAWILYFPHRAMGLPILVALSVLCLCQDCAWTHGAIAGACAQDRSGVDRHHAFAVITAYLRLGDAGPFPTNEAGKAVEYYLVPLFIISTLEDAAVLIIFVTRLTRSFARCTNPVAYIGAHIPAFWIAEAHILGVAFHTVRATVITQTDHGYAPSISAGITRHTVNDHVLPFSLVADEGAATLNVADTIFARRRSIACSFVRHGPPGLSHLTTIGEGLPVASTYRFHIIWTCIGHYHASPHLICPVTGACIILTVGSSDAHKAREASAGISCITAIAKIIPCARHA